MQSLMEASTQFRKFVRVERVNFPAVVAVVIDEPVVAGVFALIPREKGRQRGQLLLRKSGLSQCLYPKCSGSIAY